MIVRFRLLLILVLLHFVEAWPSTWFDDHSRWLENPSDKSAIVYLSTHEVIVAEKDKFGMEWFDYDKGSMMLLMRSVQYDYPPYGDKYKSVHVFFPGRKAAMEVTVSVNNKWSDFMSLIPLEQYFYIPDGGCKVNECDIDQLLQRYRVNELTRGQTNRAYWCSKVNSLLPGEDGCLSNVKRNLSRRMRMSPMKLASAKEWFPIGNLLKEGEQPKFTGTTQFVVYDQLSDGMPY